MPHALHFNRQLSLRLLTMLYPPRLPHHPHLSFNQPVKQPEHYNGQRTLNQADHLEKHDPIIQLLNHRLLKAGVHQGYRAHYVAHDHLHLRVLAIEDVVLVDQAELVPEDCHDDEGEGVREGGSAEEVGDKEEEGDLNEAVEEQLDKLEVHKSWVEVRRAPG
jgi:hypothetical protein